MLFPFSVWVKIMREILASDQTRLMTRTPCEGAYELRSAIAEHLWNFRNMQVMPEPIIIGAGTEYLYMLLHLLLGWASEQDNRYIIEDDYDSEFRTF